LLFAAGSAEVALILVELGGVFFAVGLLARLAGRLRISPIPLYLMAGLAVGAGSPIGLDASHGFIETGASIGLVLLLFFLGLEYAPRELLSTVRCTARAGVVDLLNGLPGFVAALSLGWSVTTALILGGVTYISSSGVIAKTLDDLGRIGNRETPVILGVLVIEDLVMAVFLPVLAGLVAGGTAAAVGLSVGTGVSLVAVVMVLSARFGPAMSRLIFNRSDEAMLFSLLGVTFLLAGAAEQVGVSAGIGAFLVGVAVSGAAQHRAEALIAPLRDLFAAAFFVFFALQIDPRTLTGVMASAVLLATISAITKAATGWWAAKDAGIGVPGRVRAGLTLVARGEFSIVIAGIAGGTAADADGRLGALVAAYVLLMAVSGPILARLADPLGRWLVERSQRRAVQDIAG